MKRSPDGPPDVEGTQWTLYSLNPRLLSKIKETNISNVCDAFLFLGFLFSIRYALIVALGKCRTSVVFVRIAVSKLQFL
jgi:hypothetical protein